MNFKNTWLLVAIAIVVIAIIVMITGKSEEPIPAPETTTTTEVVIEPVDILPVDGEAMDMPEDGGDINGEGDLIIE